MIRATIRKVLRPVREQLLSEPLATLSEEPGFAPTLALISSCGLHLKSDPPFDLGKRGDPSFRSFPSSVSPSDLQISHGHYDEAGVQEDWQIAFPVDAVDECLRQGRVKALHPTLYSFRGFFLDSASFLQEHVSEVVVDLQRGAVDAALFTPC